MSPQDSFESQLINVVIVQISGLAFHKLIRLISFNCFEVLFILTTRPFSLLSQFHYVYYYTFVRWECMASTEPSTCSAMVCTQVKGRKDTGTVSGCRAELTEWLKNNKYGTAIWGVTVSHRSWWTCLWLPPSVIFYIMYVYFYMYIYPVNPEGHISPMFSWDVWVCWESPAVGHSLYPVSYTHLTLPTIVGV